MAEMSDARGHNQTLYWQIYAKADLRESETEIKEAIRLGYKAFALTVDAVRAGLRERDVRVGLEEQLSDNEFDSDDDEDVDFANGQTVKRPYVTGTHLPSLLAEC